MRRSILASALLIIVLHFIAAPLAAQSVRADLSGLFHFGALPPLLTALPVPPGSAFITVNGGAFDLADPRTIREATIDRFPLGTGRSVRLSLERFDVMAPAGITVAGTTAGDVPFELEKHLIFRGAVDGIDGSYVYLAIFRGYCAGYIDLPGPDGARERYVIAPDNVGSGVPATMIVYDTRRLPLAERGHTECGAENLPGYQERVDEVFKTLAADAGRSGVKRQILSSTALAAQVAVECDMRYFQAHSSSLSQSANYALIVLGSSSAIYQRDMNVALQIPYLRIWTTVGPYTGPAIDNLLGQIREYWGTNMSSVGRSTTVMLSHNVGGGLAWVNVLCGNAYGYAVVGLNNNVNFPADNYIWDVDVTSHELGHNFGAAHTHNCSWAPPIDSCVVPEGGCSTETNPHPGSIMSYCHLNVGTQLYFHPRVATLIRRNFELSECVAPVLNALPNDVAVVGIVKPALGGKITSGTSFIPSVIVRNLGTAPQTGLPVTLAISSSTTGTGLYTGTQTIPSLAPGATATVTFAPATLTTADIYDVKASVLLANDDAGLNNTMVRPFEVAAATSAAVITVKSPNGGETFPAGATLPIKWTATGAQNLTIQFSPDNGINWSAVRYSQGADAGTIDWIVPPVPTTQARIRINDLADASANDLSDAAFTITVGKDIQAIDFITPVAADSAATPVSPRVEFRNNGTQIARDVPVRLRMMWRTDGAEVYNRTATIPEIAPGATQAVDFPATPLMPSGSHVMIARAFLDGDEAPSNDSIGRTCDLGGLAPPVGLKAYPMSHATLLMWDVSPSPGVTSYQLYRGTSRDNMVPVATLRPSVLAYADEPLTDGTEYFYGIAATAGTKQSIYSKVVAVTPATYPAGFTLAAPALLLPEAGASRLPVPATLLWHRTAGAEIYQVQVGTSAAMTDVLANRFTQELTIPFDAGFASSCYWRVRAFNYSSVGPWSEARGFGTADSCGGSAIALDGATAIMTAPAFAWSDTAITVEYWNYVRSADVQSGSAFSIGTKATNDRIQAHSPWSDRQLYWDYGDISAGGRLTTDYSHYLDKWTHVALVSDGHTSMGIYLDGVLVASGATASTPEARSRLTIGRFVDGGYHKGRIDEFRIWNRVRSAEEIRGDMSRRLPLPGPGLMGYWHFDEGAGTLAVDASGRGGDGTLSADTLWSASGAPINCDNPSPLNPPLPVAPANGAGFTVRFAPTLSWGGVPRATAYGLQLSADSGFATVERDIPDIAALSAPVVGLRSGTLYHWRVRAGNSTGMSAWSPVMSFTTGGGCQVSAIDFNGKKGVVSADSFAFTGRGTTVEFWNYVDSASVKSSSGFSVGVSDDQSNRFQSHSPWSDKFLYWDFGDIGTMGRISANYAPYLNRWTHVALVSNGIDFKAIYFNGEPAATSATAGSVHGLSKLTIGGLLPSWYHSGMIDEFRIWNTPRTAEAIRSDMYRRLPAPQSGLIGYWSLDEGTGSAAHDSSGFAHDGLLVNSPAWESAPVPVSPFPEPVSGPAICSPDSANRIYTVPFDPGGSYTWNVIGGKIVAGAGTGSITVQWTDSVDGIVALRTDRDGGCSDSAYMPVTVRVGLGVGREEPVVGLSFTGAPDPFNASTVIHYQLLRRERVALALYSLDGTLVRRLVDGTQDAGSHESIFNGAGLPSGIYICRLDVGDGYRYIKALHLVR